VINVNESIADDLDTDGDMTKLVPWLLDEAWNSSCAVVE